KLRVVATTSLIADVVANVGGDRVELLTLIPPGVDPHGYTATPADLRTLSDAHAIFVNGLGLEESMASVLENPDGNAIVVWVNSGVETLDAAEAEHADEAADEGELHHDGSDPHTWLNVQNVMHWVENIEHVLGELDPANVAAYENSAATYSATLAALEREVRTAAESVPAERRKLVTDHDALGYFAATYGFAVVGAVIPSFSTLAVGSAQELAALQDQIEAEAVTAIFVGASANPALSAQIANDLGIAVVVIYPESLSDASGPAATYVAMMRYNINAIVDALR
ncbi:MAG: metal ABC transporter substrate-binding protein, partial [Chloroflexota bacterium]|nr:metal ABC transporter substrate-binding protein [Chloroflexota bacterium]